LNTYASNEVTSRSIAEIVAYNNSDPALKKFGQGRFDGMLSDKTTGRITANKGQNQKKVNFLKHQW
jgi:ABC-type amino acid transport substrate-binding protein